MSSLALILISARTHAHACRRLSSVFALVDSHQKPVEDGTPQKDEDELTRNDGDAIGLVLRIGGVAALIAGIFGLRLAVRHRAALSA